VEAAKRARQINTYTRQLEENQLDYFGPLVEAEPDEKPLTIALREVVEDKLQVIPGDEARARRAENEKARRAAEEDMFSDIPLDAVSAPAEGEDAPASTNLDEIEF
jgi:DNA-directed RNA polymerase, omega subunit